MSLAIPTRKPIFESSNGNAGGFLDSILSTIENVSDSAFKVSGNIVAVKNLFDDGIHTVNNQGVEAELATRNLSDIGSTKSGFSNTTLISFGFAAVGLILLLDD